MTRLHYKYAKHFTAANKKFYYLPVSAQAVYCNHFDYGSGVWRSDSCDEADALGIHLASILDRLSIRRLVLKDNYEITQIKGSAPGVNQS